MPNDPAISARTKLSTSNCRTTRDRLAPSESRIAISRPLAWARASSRLPTFAHAITSTNTVVTSRIIRVGRARVVIVATMTSLLGCVLVALLPLPVAAIAGFALAGVAVGALVPLAFTSAGALAPARSDEIIARVNLFNYAGAVLGAVLLGLLADSPGLGVAFLLPAVLLVPVLFIARLFRAPVAAGAVPVAVGRNTNDAASVDR